MPSNGQKYLLFHKTMGGKANPQINHKMAQLDKVYAQVIIIKNKLRSRTVVNIIYLLKLVVNCYL